MTTPLDDPNYDPTQIPMDRRAYEEYSSRGIQQAQWPEAIPVHIASSEATPIRPAASEYCSFMTWTVDTFANMGQPIQILTRRYRRHKARILIPNLGGSYPGWGGLRNTGSQTSPGAGTVIATVSPPAIWVGVPIIIQWMLMLSGTTGASDFDNFGLFINGGQIATSINPGAAFGPTAMQNITNALSASGNTVQVKAVAAGTASSVYTAALTITPVNTVLTGTATLILNRLRDPLTLTTPQGLAISQAPLELDWESQEPCYAVLAPSGGGPLTVSVMDECYEES